MIEIAAALEATPLAQALKASRWVYPFVNAGHILGIALLIGAVVPMDLTAAGLVRRVTPRDAAALLRPFALAGFGLAAGCGALLFVTQAGDYLGNPYFLAKMGLIALAGLNAALHWRASADGRAPGRTTALVSLALWPVILVLGRLVGYTF